MKNYFNHITEHIQLELRTIDMNDCDITIDESVHMMDFMRKCLHEMRKHFLSLEPINIQDEIIFFKEIKPEALGMLLYFNKIHNIELRRPTGSNDTQKEYYENELKSLTFFFQRNLDFYQYYRSKSTYLDECYFVRGNFNPQLCSDSAQFIHDPLFSTCCDFKVAKIICNEMLRIYLNKKILRLDKFAIINKNRALLPITNFKWTGSKVAAIEFGYALHSCKSINRGNVDVKDIMMFIEACFNIDLGDYYRTYITIKSRKKDRTPFLNFLIESLIKRMNEDDAKG